MTNREWCRQVAARHAETCRECRREGLRNTAALYRRKALAWFKAARAAQY